MSRIVNRLPSSSAALACALGSCLLTLAACKAERDPLAAPEPSETAIVDDPAHRASIIRPEMGEPIMDSKPELGTLHETVGFPDGGTAIGEAARAVLDRIMVSPQFALGGPIELRGHTDSAGDDARNLRASRQRAEAVRDWLVAKEVVRERISVIAIGEGRPIAPNTRLDGSPDEAGRAKNRRVDVTLPVPEDAEPQPPATPTQKSAPVAPASK